MEGDDWLRRGVLVSNLPTSDDVTTDKLEIHFSKRSNGGGDVEDIVMLDNFMAIVKFKEEKTVKSILAKRSQCLLDSILTITRYTKSDMEYLKASSITSTNRPVSVHSCNGYDGSEELDTDGDSTEQCSCYGLFQVFANISASIPFSKLEPGLLESGKRTTLNRISVETGVQWDVDSVKRLLILSGSFDEVRFAAAKLQHYTISEDAQNGDDQADSITLAASANETTSKSLQRSPRPSPSGSPLNRPKKIHKTEDRSSAEHSNLRTQLQANGRLKLDTSNGSEVTQTASEKARCLAGRQNSIPQLKLRSVVPDISVRKKVPLMHQKKQHDGLSDDSDKDVTYSRTNGYMAAPGKRDANDRHSSPNTPDVQKSELVPAKVKHTAKVDIASLDPKLLRYIMTVRKSEIENIEQRLSVKIITTEKGQVSVEVNKDANEWESNLRGSISKFHTLLCKVRAQDQDAKTFGLVDLKLTGDDLDSDKDFTYSRTNGHMAARGKRDANERHSSANTPGVQKSELVPAKVKHTAKVDIASLDPKLLRYIMTVRKSEIENIEHQLSVKIITTEKGQVSVEVNKNANEWESNLRGSISNFQTLLCKVRAQDPDAKTFGLVDLKLTGDDLEEICRKAHNANPEITAELLEDHSCIQVYGTSSAIEQAEEWFQQEVFAVYRDLAEEEEDEDEDEDDIERDGEDELDENEYDEDEEETYEEEEDTYEEEEIHEVRNGITQLALTSDKDEQKRDSWKPKPTSCDVSSDQIMKPISYLSTTNTSSERKPLTSHAGPTKEGELLQKSFSANVAKGGSATTKTRSAPVRDQSSHEQGLDNSTPSKKPTAALIQKRVIEKQFDQEVLNYIQLIHFGDINKFRNRYGVDFDMKVNGIVQVRQRSTSDVSDMKVNVAMGELTTLVNNLTGNLESHTIDIRTFEDVPQKIIDLAIRNAKENKSVMVNDGLGCRVKLFGTKDKIDTAVKRFLHIIKTGTVDDKPKEGMKAVGKQQSRTSPTNACSFGDQSSSGQSERKTKHNMIPRGVGSASKRDTAKTDDFDFQAARNATKSYKLKAGDFDMNVSWRTKDSFAIPNSVNARSFNPPRPAFDASNQIQSSDSLLGDPRNYLELNEEADKLMESTKTGPSNDDHEDFSGRQNWYEGDLQSVLTNNGVTQHTSMRNAEAAVTNSFSTIGGARGGDEFDDSDEETGSGGLMDDIGNFGDLDDDVSASGMPLLPTPADLHDEIPYLLQTSAGFDIEIQNGDITSEFVSVIVTSADPHMRPNTGAARAVQNAGGVGLVRECQKWVAVHGTVDVSRPIYTSGGNLMCSQVLHVIPPDQDSEAANIGGNPLTDMMQSVMKICAKPLKATSIAMPAIGIDSLQIRKGIYARYLFEAVLDCIKYSTPHGTTLRKLKIVDKNPSLVDTLRTTFTKMSSDPTNRHFFQPGARPSSPAAPNFNAGAKPKRHNRRRNTSWNKDGKRNQHYQNGLGGTFHSERTRATAFDDRVDDDVDTESKSMSAQDDSSDEADKCPVCLDTIKQPRRLKCKHTFCQKCLDQSTKHQGQTCPVCKQPFGKGRRARTMPSGNMDVSYDSTTRVPGYPDANGAIIITYSFTSGIQSPLHPNPGHTYHGTARTTYLPDNPEGRDVLNLLKRAFDSKLTFTIGTSSSTGQQDVIVWNDIHHKTSVTGGPQNHGYPDPQYLARVRKELEDKGIR